MSATIFSRSSGSAFSAAAACETPSAANETATTRRYIGVGCGFDARTIHSEPYLNGSGWWTIHPSISAAVMPLAITNFLAKQGRDAMRKEPTFTLDWAWIKAEVKAGALGYFRMLPLAAVLLLAALALTGCAGHVRYASIYCLSQKQFAEIQKAEPPKVGNKLTGNAQDDLKTIAGSAIELRQYDGDLLNVLNGCVDPNAGAAAKTQ